VSRGQRGGSPTVVNLSFLERIISYIVTKIIFCVVTFKVSRVFRLGSVREFVNCQNDSDFELRHNPHDHET
jgi:hypothetical protein